MNNKIFLGICLLLCIAVGWLLIIKVKAKPPVRLSEEPLEMIRVSNSHQIYILTFEGKRYLTTTGFILELKP